MSHETDNELNKELNKHIKNLMQRNKHHNINDFWGTSEQVVEKTTNNKDQVHKVTKTTAQVVIFSSVLQPNNIIAYCVDNNRTPINPAWCTELHCCALKIYQIIGRAIVFTILVNNDAVTLINIGGVDAVQEDTIRRLYTMRLETATTSTVLKLRSALHTLPSEFTIILRVYM